jgi:hypothetical protein
MPRTITIKNGSGSIEPGWKEVTIKKADYGVWGEGENATNYLDIWFNELPETLNMRVYEAKDSKGNEFAIGTVFRFANAGIKTVLDGPSGEKSVTIDDNPNNLKDRKLNVFLYPDPNNTKYSRVLKQPAPTEFKNEVETFTTQDVQYHKGRAEVYFNKYVKKDTPNNAVNVGQQDTQGVTVDDLPF